MCGGSETTATFQETTTTTLLETTTTTLLETTTTTTPTISVLPSGYYWGQYSDGTWGIRLFPDQPENFEWAWDVFNREDPYGYYGYDEFDENSTLIGTLVNFDCSFNRISKTEEHKAVFGLSETTIEYYDTYFDWAEDNYDYLTEEAVITISKIMRGVWTCDYEYLDSISTEFLDYVHSGDAYVEVPKFSRYIESFEDNYDDDHRYGKYTYTLGALLYMTPAEAEVPVSKLECEPPGIQWIGNELYQWPMESKNPKQLRENQVAKMSMFDNGVTKSLINGTYQGDDGTYGFRLQITTEGIWKAYKYTGHTWPSGYSKELPYYECPESTNDGAYKGTTPYINGIRIVKGDTFDSFIIDLDITQDSDLIPNSPYIARCDRETCTIDPEMGPFIPDYVEEWLYISFPGYSIVRNSDGGWLLDNERTASTFSGQRIVESDGPILYGRAYGEFEANLELSVGIVPGSIFRSYETANPQTIVIEVDK